MKNKIKMAKELLELSTKIKELTKRAEEIKKAFKTNYSIGLHKLGPVIIELKALERTNVDKNAIMGDYGPDFFTEYETKTNYVTLQVKKGA